MRLPATIASFRKSGVDVRRRLMDLSLTLAMAPAASAVSAMAMATLIANGETKLLKKRRRVGLDGFHFNRLSFNTPTAPRRLPWLVELLKRSHAYDLPVLINVLKGEMALVGPEALSPERVEELDERELACFAIRPGLSDVYYIRRRMNIAYDRRSALERTYLAERGVIKDLTILARTIPTLLLGRSKPVHVNSFVLQDITIANISIHEAIDRLSAMSERRKKHVCFANPHCFNVSYDDEYYRRILKKADMVLPDGIGVNLAGFVVGAELRENVNGTDLFPRLCQHAERMGKSLFLLGADPGVADAVAMHMMERYPELDICGTADGYFQDGSEREEEIIEAINASRPDFLLVARGVPLQEKWIDSRLSRMDIGVGMGVGGLFDFYSGRIPRAPLWVREIGLEWFWRFLQEPDRMFSRYFIGNPRFLYNSWKWYVGQVRTGLIRRFDGIDMPMRRIQAESPFHIRRMLWWLATEGTLKVKRGVDIAGASTGLFLLSPIMAATALSIKLEDPSGPVFYKHERIGRYGRPFQMMKFRSMFVDADKRKQELMDRNESKAGVIFKMKNDPRITRTGKIIRRFSIDEMPQLWNILIGDMSLVGPRPPIPSEVDQYKVTDRLRLDVTPGLTGLWQVKGRSLLDFNQQVELDREYIYNQSLLGDLRLILRTIPVVLSGYGAF